MRLVFLSGSLTAVGWPRRSTDERSSGGLTMLLSDVWGCMLLPFGFEEGVFVLEVWFVVAPPSAGEARALAVALRVPPPPVPAAGVEGGILRGDSSMSGVLRIDIKTVEGGQVVTDSRRCRSRNAGESGAGRDDRIAVHAAEVGSSPNSDKT